jgi:hypothetical protein
MARYLPSTALSGELFLYFIKLFHIQVQTKSCQKLKNLDPELIRGYYIEELPANTELSPQINNESNIFCNPNFLFDIAMLLRT